MSVVHRSVTDVERLHRLVDAMLVLGEEAPLHELLQRIVDASAELVGARYAALGVLDDEGAGLRAFITHGVTDEERAAIGTPPTGRGALGQLIVDRKPLRLEALSAAPFSVGFPPSHPAMRSFLGVPVWVRDDQVFGNLYLCDRLDGEPFTDDDEALLVALGRAAGLVLAEAKVREQLREMTLNDERARLARDLHDSVIQRLFAVGLTLQSVVGGGLPQEAGAQVHHCIDELDTTIREIRTTIFELTTVTEPTGWSLRRRILELVDEVTSRLGLPVSVSFSGPVDTAIGAALCGAGPPRRPRAPLERRAPCARRTGEPATRGRRWRRPRSRWPTTGSARASGRPRATGSPTWRSARGRPADRSRFRRPMRAGHPSHLDRNVAAHDDDPRPPRRRPRARAPWHPRPARVRR